MINYRYIIILFTIVSINFHPAAVAAAATSSIIHDPNIQHSSTLSIIYDPPNNHMEPSAISVFARGSDPISVIYYELDSDGTTCNDPTTSSNMITYSTPYIEVKTLFKGKRNRILKLIAVILNDVTGIPIYRSQQYELNYIVEGGDRPYSYGFLVPGTESNGYFLRFRIQVPATARAQSASGQEFADFFSYLGYGTYPSTPYPQIKALNLVNIDPDLQGFEGGFAVNVTDDTGLHFGILIPWHNGETFFGKVVKVNLQDMENITDCERRVLSEALDDQGQVIYTIKTAKDASTACIHILDLTTLHPNAKGFRKGFLGYPYGYLSPGQFNVPVRLNLVNFTLSTASYIDLGLLDRTYGGYSGGFADGSWACFSPFLTFSGPVGGIRSELFVDANRLTPYFYSVMICIDETGWNEEIATNRTSLQQAIQLMDFSTMDDDLRGFSDAIRVGRYAYLSPCSYSQNIFSSKLIRIDLGDIDIGTKLMETYKSGGTVRNVVDILDLSKKNIALKGFSSLFMSGQNLILVPFRNNYEPQTGQRGHGNVVRLNMNLFDDLEKGIEYIDVSAVIRAQIPSFGDTNLRGFAGGFASGYYGILVPFYNKNFNGKVPRFQPLSQPFLNPDPTQSSANLQELDLEVDRDFPNTYRGYKGGFVSYWKGVDE